MTNLSLSRCAICPCTKGRSPVPPSGPSPCRVLFLGEAPHKFEDSALIPFCGPSGVELDEQYLPLAGLDRPSVAVANACLCSQLSYRNPKPAEASICASKHLSPLLARLRPEIIVPMGAVACSLFPSLRLSLHHGLPQPGTYGSWEGIVFPSYHPAAGLRSTAYMIPLRQDMIALGKLIKSIDNGSFSWPSDPYPSTDYQVIRTESGVFSYLFSTLSPAIQSQSRVKDLSWLLHILSLGLSLATDTETRPDGSPYCLTFSASPSTGRLIYSRDRHLIERYIHTLRQLDPLLSFHNYLFDARPYSTMGIPIPPNRFLDTMVRAFELCLGGGGDEEDSGGRGSLSLKVLAYRHLHMQMKTFKEVVFPHTLPHILNWLTLCHTILTPDSTPLCRCSHPQSRHAPRGKSSKLTGPCSCGNCSKWVRLPPPKHPDDKSLSLTLGKLNSLHKAISAGEVTGVEKGVENGEGEESIGESSGYMGPDPWKRVRQWGEGERAMLEDLAGPMPVMDIALVPEPELLDYAVRDADATGRLGRYLSTVKIGL